MRGQESDGITFDEIPPLTPEQAGQVIVLFSEYLDTADIRLEVPRGHNRLASSDDGGYLWCEKCGAVTYEDAEDCDTDGCPLRAEFEEDTV
ncbi:MAG TPA: hypothetical protein ENI07_13020 [Desulfobacterales bacterium]|nr:hypothetical protein [Desulfobacterales bacterium]